METALLYKAPCHQKGKDTSDSSRQHVTAVVEQAQNWTQHANPTSWETVALENVFFLNQNKCLMKG